MYTLFTELPIVFSVPLEDTEVTEEDTVKLTCETSKPKAGIKWMKNGVEITPGLRYKMTTDGCHCTLTVLKAALDDNNTTFSCVVPSSGETTSATLTVHGRLHLTYTCCTFSL